MRPVEHTMHVQNVKQQQKPIEQFALKGAMKMISSWSRLIVIKLCERKDATEQAHCSLYSLVLNVSLAL